jgi:hypothetical protein
MSVNDIDEDTFDHAASEAAARLRAIDFINEAARDEMVYLLVRDGMCIHTDSIDYVKDDNEPMDVIPVWTKSYCEGAKTWAEEHATLEEMPIGHFIEEFLPEIEENFCTIGMNWDKDGVGIELPPYHIVNLLVKKATGAEITDEDLIDETEEEEIQ